MLTYKIRNPLKEIDKIAPVTKNLKFCDCCIEKGSSDIRAESWVEKLQPIIKIIIFTTYQKVGHPRS